MKRFLNLTTVLLAACLISACYSKGNVEGPAALSSDSGSITATAEFAQEDPDSVKVVKIRSNRSWYAHLNDLDNPVGPTEEVPWGYIDTRDHFNLTGVEDEVAISVYFRRNYTETAVNGVLDFFTDGKKFLSIPVSQQAAVFRLNATPDKEEANCDSDQIKILVDCNTAWTAEILEGATADVSLNKNSGFDPDTLTVSFTDNYDATSKKYASVKLSTKSGLEKTLNLSQSKAIPYLRLSPDSPANITPGLTSSAVLIQTNCNWTARLKDGSTLSDVVISNTSGSAAVGNQPINFTFTNSSDDPHVSNSATFIITADGVDTPIEATVNQIGTIFLDFCSKNPTFTTFTPEIQSKTSNDVGTHTFKTSYGEYTIVNYSNYINASSGLLYKQYDKNKEIGKQYAYLTLPGIDGFTLKKILFTFRYNASNHKYTMTIKDAEGNAYTDAVVGDIPDTEDHLSNGEITLGEGKAVQTPKPGVAYTITATANKNCYIFKMNLIYE